MISADNIIWSGAILALIGVVNGFYLLAQNNTGKHHIITLFLAISGVTIMIIGGIQNQEEHQNDYQSLKPSLDMKPCAELEKTITFGMNQTIIDFSKRNYNERCL